MFFAPDYSPSSPLSAHMKNLFMFSATCDWFCTDGSHMTIHVYIILGLIELTVSNFLKLTLPFLPSSSLLHFSSKPAVYLPVSIALHCWCYMSPSHGLIKITVLSMPPFINLPSGTQFLNFFSPSPSILSRIHNFILQPNCLETSQNDPPWLTLPHTLPAPMYRHVILSRIRE